METLLPIADLFSPETLALLIPITALMIPIVAILVSHQQKMAQIVHSAQGRSTEVTEEIQALREEVRSLREIVHQQTIALDSATNPRVTPPPTDSIQQRLGS